MRISDWSSDVCSSVLFRDFDSYLIPPATFDALREKGPLPLAIETDFDRHIEERRARLDTAIEQVTVLARQGELPQVRLDESGLIISPLKAATPPATRSEEHTSEIQSLMRSSYADFC